MATRYDASVNGVLLSSLDERIIVTDVREGAPRTRISTAEKPVNAGSFLVRSKRQSLSVTIAFVLWERDVAQRKKLLDMVKSWAIDGKSNVSLGVNDRPGQYLNARVFDPPVIPSALKWLDEILLTFEAYEFPFWRQTEPVTVTTTGSEVTMDIPGNGEALVDVSITNKGSAPFTFFYIYAADRYISFDALDFPQGSVLNITHDQYGYLHAEIGGVSVLPLLYETSDDDLTVWCGRETSFSISTLSDENPEFEAVFSVQGVWL